MEISIETKYYEWPIWGCSCPTKFVNRWSGVQVPQPAPKYFQQNPVLGNGLPDGERKRTVGLWEFSGSFFDAFPHAAIRFARSDAE